MTTEMQPTSQHAQPGYWSSMKPVSRFTVAAGRLKLMPRNHFRDVQEAAWRSRRAWPSDATFVGPWAVKAEKVAMRKAVTKLKSMR